MDYAVTFCATDPKVGSNPLWHACVIFSKKDPVTKKLEVIDNWEFYGLPSTDHADTFIRRKKIQYGLDVDLFGNHGKWRHEETRFLDRGEGLHGRTFELTEEQFNALQQHFVSIEQKETEAIQEIATFLNLKPKKEFRIYAYEDDSPLIYSVEKTKAREDKRASRLNAFEFRPGWDWRPHLSGPSLWGPNLRDSASCKSQAISALSCAQTPDGKPILSAQQIDELTEHGRHPTVPRYSGPMMENIYLHSTGPLVEFTKKSGAKVYSRKELAPNGTRLFWTLPPQKADFLTEESAALCKIDEGAVSQAGNVISKLQRLEWALRNAQVPEQYKEHQNNLINTIIAAYEAFSALAPKSDDHKIGGYKGMFLNWLSLPKSAAERDLNKEIGNARALLNEIYMAMADGWKLEADSEDCVAVVTCLAGADKKLLCNILGRNYVEPLILADEEDCEFEDRLEEVAESAAPRVQ